MWKSIMPEKSNLEWQAYFQEKDFYRSERGDSCKGKILCFGDVSISLQEGYIWAIGVYSIGDVLARLPRCGDIMCCIP